jgi:hypothetical protein
MKFYKRDPDRALAGMSGLTPAQRGIYNSVIDLIYSRDGIVPCITDADDRRIAKNISVAPQTWRRFKTQLRAIGKIRITNQGLLTANGVEDCMKDASKLSDSQRLRATNRWANYRLRKQFNTEVVPHGNAINSKSKNSEIPSPLEHAKPLAVDNGENSIGAERETTTKSIATDELSSLIKSKWLGR